MSDSSHSDDPPRSPSRRAEGRCGGCGQGATHMRRGLCSACYARWVRARPVGLGASCAACADRRIDHLRHYELRGLWVVLCHNCCARGERVAPAARSLDALLLALRRERRVSGERRTAAEDYWYGVAERRRRQLEGRRATDRAIDASELVIEMEADFATPNEERTRDPDEPITAVHSKVEPADR